MKKIFFVLFVLIVFLLACSGGDGDDIDIYTGNEDQTETIDSKDDNDIKQTSEMSINEIADHFKFGRIACNPKGHDEDGMRDYSACSYNEMMYLKMLYAIKHGIAPMLCWNLYEDYVVELNNPPNEYLHIVFKWNEKVYNNFISQLRVAGYDPDFECEGGCLT